MYDCAGTPGRVVWTAVFHEPDLVRHARLIVERRLHGQRYEQIANDLGLTEYHMQNCAKTVRIAPTLLGGVCRRRGGHVPLISASQNPASPDTELWSVPSRTRSVAT